MKNESEKALEAEIKLLKEQNAGLEQEIRKSMGILSDLDIPTNGVGGIGKREVLTLSQRIEMLVEELRGTRAELFAELDYYAAEAEDE